MASSHNGHGAPTVGWVSVAQPTGWQGLACAEPHTPYDILGRSPINPSLMQRAPSA